MKQTAARRQTMLKSHADFHSKRAITCKQESIGAELHSSNLDTTPRLTDMLDQYYRDPSFLASYTKLSQSVPSRHIEYASNHFHTRIFILLRLRHCGASTRTNIHNAVNPSSTYHTWLVQRSHLRSTGCTHSDYLLHHWPSVAEAASVHA